MTPVNIVLNHYVYSLMYCEHCHADVEPKQYSMSRMDYLDLDCPRCDRHLATLHRNGGPQSEIELERALLEANVPYGRKGP